MWPYEFFNTYSALINEFDVNISDFDIEEKPKTKKIFIAKWFGVSDEEKKREEIKYKSLSNFLKSIDTEKIITSEIEGEIEDSLKYRMKATIAKEVIGDINIDILSKIIESTLVICDITPMRDDDKGAVFNPNVMAELGLALAWKLPEQVIVLRKKEEINKEYRLPFNIQGYFVKEVDFDNLDNSDIKLKDYIKDRIDKLNLKESILIKNIICKLDEYSLLFLDQLHGQMFVQQLRISDHLYHMNLDTVRHLLNLGILRIEIFPQSPSRTYGYCLTDLGRFLLHKLKVKLYPKVFTEFLRVSYWRAYKGAEFNKQKRGFDNEFNKKWYKCDKELKQILKNKGEKQDKQVITMFNNHCIKLSNNFDIVCSQIIGPWLEKIKLL